MSTFKNLFTILAVLLVGLIFAPGQTVSAQFHGAIYDTDHTSIPVNQNSYTDKLEVYLNGGPQNDNANGLPLGVYYFQVTDPSGAVLLSTDPAVCRQAVVAASPDGKGRIAGAYSGRPAFCTDGTLFPVDGIPAGFPGNHADGIQNPYNFSIAVQLMPYNDTPNDGGVYKIWLIPVGKATIDANDNRVLHFSSSDAKTDNFSVEEEEPPPPPFVALEVTKTADGTYDRTVTWQIEKTVTPGSHDGQAGENAGTSTWTVEATKNEVSDNFAVSGTITVKNFNTIPVATIVDDVLSDSTQAVIDCGPFINDDPAQGVLVPAALGENDPGVLTCSYTATPSEKADTNTAMAIPLTEGIPMGEDVVVDIDWDVNLIGDDTVKVDDDRDTESQFPAEISETTTFDYDETFACSSNQGDYTDGKDTDIYSNTATLTGENTGPLTDSADVTVNCSLAALGVSKTAEGAYDLTHSWTLTKSANPTSFSGYAGDSFNPSDLWTVVADKTTTTGNYSVTGEITINNTASIAQTFTVVDVLNNGGGAANVSCPSNTVAAGGSVVCTYSASPADASATLNTVTLSAAGNSDQSATADVSFTANVIGDNTTTLGDARFNFSQSVSVDTTKKFSDFFACSSMLSDYTNGMYSYSITNIATLLGDSTDLEASATVNVTCRLRYADETATGRGPGWPGSNWFMYTPCAIGTTIDLIAGQHYDAGDITISGTCENSKTGTNTITIQLHDGFRLANVSNNVKIEPMKAAPSKSLPPGQFSIKKTFTQGTITIVVEVPKALYYGIHLDVQRAILP